MLCPIIKTNYRLKRPKPPIIPRKRRVSEKFQSESAGTESTRNPHVAQFSTHALDVCCRLGAGRNRGRETKKLDFGANVFVILKGAFL